MTNLNTKLIGILAGMGPRSTAPFVDLVVTECQRQYGARLDEDFPPMMILSWPTPFYVDRPINHTLMQNVISQGLQRLAATGAAFIAMPCNSAHIYHAALAASINIPLLNMVDAAIQAIPPQAQRIGLLATRATVEAGIYHTGVERMGKALVHTEAWQRDVDHLILTIKTNPDRRAAVEGWHTVMGNVEKAYVDAVILACTDLNVVRYARGTLMPMVDATECLAQVTVRQWLAAT